MKVDVKREARSRAVLEVEIPPESVSEGVEAALRKLNQKVEIPGFRRGKAPRTMLERYVGRETVLEEAVKELLLVPAGHPDRAAGHPRRALARHDGTNAAEQR